MRFMNFMAAYRKPNYAAFGVFPAEFNLDWIADSYGTPGLSVNVSGTQDGTNTVFTMDTSSGPFMVIKNGLVLKASLDYSILGRTLTFASAPESDAVIQVISGGVIGGGIITEAFRYSPVGIRDGENTTFTVPSGTYGLLILLHNGQILSPSVGYSLSEAGVLTLTTAPSSDDTLEAIIVP